MKAIGRLIAKGTVVIMLLAGPPAFAGPVETSTQLAVSTLIVGQNEPPEAERRAQADGYLKQARVAMQQGKLDLAERHLQNAEKLKVKYDSLFTRFIDTPEKVRRDLEALQSGDPAKPSNRFAPPATGTASQDVPEVPFGNAKTSPLLKPVGPTPSGTSPASGLKPADISKNDLQRLPPISGDTARASLSDSNAGDLAKQQTLRLLARAKAALDRGDIAAAQQLTQQAEELGVPDRNFTEGEIRPWEMRLQISQVMRRGGSAVVPAGNFTETPGNNSVTDNPQAFPVAQGVYRPDNDSTRMELAQSQQPVAPGAPTPGMRLFNQGIEALERQDRGAALQFFREAWQFESEFDPLVRQQLKDKLSLLSANNGPVGVIEPTPLQAIDSQQNLLRQKLFREIATAEKEAGQMMSTDPKGALEHLQRTRDRVAQSDVDPASRKQLLTLVDRRVGELQIFIDQHRGEIELGERNRMVLEEIDRGRAMTIEVQDKVADLVEDFNDLIEEQRFAEAEVIAKQVRELVPESPIARTLMLNSRLGSRIHEQEWIQDQAEDGFVRALTSVDQSRIPFDDREPFVFGDAKRWAELSQSRREMLEMQRRRLSPVEIRIQEALKTQVEVRFTNRPLKEVLDTLGSMAGINIYADAEGLSAEGVTTDTPVTINLTQPISLKSALHLVLEPLRLSYVVQHEVLRITSEQARDSNVYPTVYNVADLVISIPNFVPGYNMGLPSAIREAHRSLGYGGVVQPASMAPLTIASNELDNNATLNSNVLAQTGAYGMLPNGGTRPSQSPSPGAGGGAALADFDTLIELITSTIAPESWDTVGGPGAVESFPTNLSLVISQTQDVHDQIADLLDQLRRLQDLQVTIEVRFITLQDNFFERIGVDFDFDIDDNVTQLPFDDSGPSVTIGLDGAGNPTADLDLSFNQSSFGLASPTFGGFQGANAASFGFAILSDIEAFFLLEAAQGDTRSNVLQAPKVTLFNGQQASVNDTSQRPFVTSLIPVVGDFAAAHQPVIVVLSEGTSLTVQAVVSSDRRFVRLTLQPVFSQIGNVETFTFDGRTTTNTGSNVLDANGDPTGEIDNTSTTTEGTTVQLPTFSFTTVSTTVSVPDGGTILLGGIKRLREGRNEHGIPMLSKLPYVNRLFKNVGIGRETQSLMLMVTPRIIIQEEEEERLGIE